MASQTLSSLTTLVDEAVAATASSYDEAWRPTDPPSRTATAIASLIDHTALKPDTTAVQIDQLCTEAKLYGFASVCVNPTWVARCSERLAGSDVKVCTVVGFPLGAMLPESKACETEHAITAGATEIDMVINVGQLKDGQYDRVYEDIVGVTQVAHERGALVKVILEMCLLTTEEKVAASVIARTAGVDFIKTSTGFNGGGATLPDVALMRAAAGPEIGIKAAGGVKNADDVCAFASAGATRIGASAGVTIMRSLANEENVASSEGTY